MASYQRLGNLYANQKLGSFESQFGSSQLGGNLLTSLTKRLVEVRGVTGALTGRTEREQRAAAAEEQQRLDASVARKQRLEEEDIEFQRRLAASKSESEKLRIEKQIAARQQELEHRFAIEKAEIQLAQQQQQQIAASERARLKAAQSKSTLLAFSIVAVVMGLVSVAVLGMKK